MPEKLEREKREEDSDSGIDIHIGGRTVGRWTDKLPGFLIKLIWPAIALGGPLGVDFYHRHKEQQPAAAASAAPAPRALEQVDHRAIAVLEVKVAAVERQSAETERKVESGNLANSVAMARLEGKLDGIQQTLRQANGQ